MIKLFIKAFSAAVLGLALIMLLLFLPAGTFCFVGGWLFLGVLFVPMIIMGAVLFLKNPAMLEKRLKTKEEIGSQKAVVALSGLMFAAGFVIAGLNFRFGWAALPFSVSIAASVIFLIGYGLYVEVIRENAYLSRVIEVQENQKVVDTGLYSVVRHPMYFATVLMFLAIPLILGDIFSFILFLVYPFMIAKRIKDEEKLLENELDGYKEYKNKVKYRLIPFVW